MNLYGIHHLIIMHYIIVHCSLFIVSPALYTIFNHEMR